MSLTTLSLFTGYTTMSKVVLVSGSFDPLHIGHIAYLKAAKRLGDTLVVAIKGNERVKAKKQRHFMDEKERKIILESLKFIDKVVVIDAPNEGMIAPLAIDFIQPDIYACGETERNEELETICRLWQVDLRYGIGGKRIRSSSELLQAYTQTPWEK